MNNAEQNLADLLGVYTDVAYDVYKEFLYHLNNDGINLGLMFQSKFRLAKPGQTVPLEVAIPQTHSRIITSNYLKKRDANNNIVDKDFNLRDLMSNFFVIFEDDEVTLTISYYKKTLIEVRGKAGELKFSFDDLLKEKNISPGDLLTVNIKLHNSGQKRQDAEQKARFLDIETFGQELSSKENIQSCLERIVDEEVLKERLKLFGFECQDLSSADLKKQISLITESNFGITEVNGLNLIIKNFHLKISNEELLKMASEDIEIVNLLKMQDWLTRIGYDGRVEE